MLWTSYIKDQKMKIRFKIWVEFFINMPEGQFLLVDLTLYCTFMSLIIGLKELSYLLVLPPMGLKPNFKYESWQDPTSCRHPSPCASSVKPFFSGQFQVRSNFVYCHFWSFLSRNVSLETLRWRCWNGYCRSSKFSFSKASSELFIYGVILSGWW